MKGISLELYKVFREIGSTGNLTRAAENLYVTQPNISAALKTLEEQLHTTLCVRTKKGVTLTHEGRVLYEELEQAFAHIQLAETKVEKLLHLESGSIAISAGDTICNYYLLPHITRFAQAHPEIRFQITNRTTLETAELVSRGEVDIGFIHLPFESASLSTTLCTEVHDILVGGAKYLPLAGTPLPASALQRHPLVMLERKSNSRLCLDRHFAQMGIALSPVLELGSLDLILSFVRYNMGLAFVPRELCGQFIDGKEILSIGMEHPLPARAIGLIELKGAVHSTAVEHFIQSLSQASVSSTPRAPL